MKVTSSRACDRFPSATKARIVSIQSASPQATAISRPRSAVAFASRPKATPSGPRLQIPRHYRVRRDRIDITGVITLRHNSRLHHIGLGRRLVGTRVLVLIDDLRIRVLTEDGELIRELILDPTRDYQPHGRSS